MQPVPSLIPTFAETYQPTPTKEKPVLTQDVLEALILERKVLYRDITNMNTTILGESLKFAVYWYFFKNEKRNNDFDIASPFGPNYLEYGVYMKEFIWNKIMNQFTGEPQYRITLFPTPLRSSGAMRDWMLYLTSGYFTLCLFKNLNIKIPLQIIVLETFQKAIRDKLSNIDTPLQTGREIKQILIEETRVRQIQKPDDIYLDGQKFFTNGTLELFFPVEKKRELEENIEKISKEKGPRQKRSRSTTPAPMPPSLSGLPPLPPKIVEQPKPVPQKEAEQRGRTPTPSSAISKRLSQSPLPKRKSSVSPMPKRRSKRSLSVFALNPTDKEATSQDTQVAWNLTRKILQDGINNSGAFTKFPNGFNVLDKLKEKTRNQEVIQLYDVSAIHDVDSRFVLLWDTLIDRIRQPTRVKSWLNENPTDPKFEDYVVTIDYSDLLFPPDRKTLSGNSYSDYNNRLVEWTNQNLGASFQNLSSSTILEQIGWNQTLKEIARRTTGVPPPQQPEDINVDEDEPTQPMDDDIPPIPEDTTPKDNTSIKGDPCYKRLLDLQKNGIFSFF